MNVVWRNHQVVAPHTPSTDNAETLQSDYYSFTDSDQAAQTLRQRHKRKGKRKKNKQVFEG